MQQHDFEEPMRTLCKMVVKMKYTDLPDKLVDYAKRLILDTIGVMIGGSAMDGIPQVVDLVKRKGGKQESLIPFYGGKVPASEAGLAIGPMARAMDLGDLHEWGGHCSEYIVPVLLASTGLKEKTSGKEFITSYVVGQEVLIRIGLAYKAFKAVPPCTIGGHYIFGAVAAAGKLLGLSLDEMENAEGIARVMTQPYDIAMYTPATLIVRVHHGFVTQDAINACLLAQKGITGPRHNVLTSHKGYLATAKWETDPGALTKGLGKHWEMFDVMMKPYAACKCTHTSIYGIVDQMKEHKFRTEDIAKIDTEQCSRNFAIACTPVEAKWHPETVPECQFSLPYTIATAAYDGRIFMESYTPQARTRRKVRNLMTRISAKEDPSLPEFGARVHTTLKDGRTFSNEYSYVKGHLQNPFTKQELVNKFKSCVPYSAYKLDDATQNSVIEAILNLEEVDDVVNDILRLLTPAESILTS